MHRFAFARLVMAAWLGSALAASPCLAEEVAPRFDFALVFGWSSGPFGTGGGPYVGAESALPIFEEDPLFGQRLSGDLLFGWTKSSDHGVFHTPDVTSLGLPLDPVANDTLDVTTFQLVPGFEYAFTGLPRSDWLEVDPYVVAGLAINVTTADTTGPGGDRVLGIGRISPDLEDRGIPAIGGNLQVGASVGAGVDATILRGLLLGVEWRRNEMPTSAANFDAITGKIGFRFSTDAGDPAAPRARAEYLYDFVFGVSTGPFGTGVGPYYGASFTIPIYGEDPILGQTLSVDFLGGWTQTKARGLFRPPNVTALGLPAEASVQHELTVTTLQIVPALKYALADPLRLGRIAVDPYVIAGIGFDTILSKTSDPGPDRAGGIVPISPELAERGIPASVGQLYAEGSFGAGVDLTLFDRLLLGVEGRRSQIPHRHASFEMFAANVGFRFSAGPAVLAAPDPPPSAAHPAVAVAVAREAARPPDRAPIRSGTAVSGAGSTETAARLREFEYAYMFGVTSGAFGTKPNLFVGGTLDLPIFASDPLFGQRLSGQTMFGWSQTHGRGTFRTPTATSLQLPIDPVANTRLAVSTFQAAPVFKYKLTSLPRLAGLEIEPYALAGISFAAMLAKTDGPGGDRVHGIVRESPDLERRGVPAAGGGVLIGSQLGGGIDVFLFHDVILGVDFRQNLMDRRGASFRTIAGKFGFRFAGAAPPLRLEHANPKPPPAPPPGKLVETTEELVPLEPIVFDLDSTAVPARSAAVLDQAARLLRDRPDLILRVEGHTDARGSADERMRLSQRRAEVVAEELVKRGVDPSRLHAVGYGSGRPLAADESEEGRARNRRTELHVVVGTSR